MEPGDFYDVPIGKVLHFIRSVGLTKGLLEGKHNRSEMVAVLGPYEALPYYIHTYILNVHSVSDVREIEIHTAEPLVPDPSPFEVEIAIAKLKTYKSPGSDQILAELIQAGGEILCSEIHTVINSIWEN
jgi:hypothetical protein